MLKLVCLSGGQDSVTTLACARLDIDKRANSKCKLHTITFDYGQRHRIELQFAKDASTFFNADAHHVVDIRGVFPQNVSAMNDSKLAVSPTGGVNGLPSTFLPMRNQILLSIALSHGVALAEPKEIIEIYTGVCQTDFSGYPDCRQKFITAFEKCSRAALDDPGIRVHTPLMYLTKAQTFALAAQMSILEYILDNTHTCYEGERTPHPWGAGCGKCPACVLRAKGWEHYCAANR